SGYTGCFKQVAVGCRLTPKGFFYFFKWQRTLYSKIILIFGVLTLTVTCQSTMTAPFLPLQKELEVIQQGLAAKALLTIDGPKQDEFLRLINRSGYLITVHDVEFYRPVCINNQTKQFYGFKHNVLQGMDHFYYLKTI